MAKRNFENTGHESVETQIVDISIGEMKENTQITINDTGWSEEEKERMKQFGYDGLDMVREWYG